MLEPLFKVNCPFIIVWPNDVIPFKVKLFKISAFPVMVELFASAIVPVVALLNVPLLAILAPTVNCILAEFTFNVAPELIFNEPYIALAAVLELAKLKVPAAIVTLLGYPALVPIVPTPT